MTRAPASIEDPASSPEATERLPGEIDAETLRKYFTLAKADREAVEQCRGAVNKVGFAIQLCTLRWQGHFLPDLQNLPSAIVETIAAQMGVLPLSIDSYPQNEKTRFEHLERIRRHLGFVRCHSAQRDRLLNYLIGIAQTMPRCEGLRQTAHRWLKQEKIDGGRSGQFGYSLATKRSYRQGYSLFLVPTGVADPRGTKRVSKLSESVVAQWAQRSFIFLVRMSPFLSRIRNP
jgi:hypothetical protein